MNINKIYYNKIQSKKPYKKIVFLFILLICVCSSCIYEHYKYNKFIDTFKSNFNDYKFSEANNLLLTEQTFNPFKLLIMNKDISMVF